MFQDLTTQFGQGLLPSIIHRLVSSGLLWHRIFCGNEREMLVSSYIVIHNVWLLYHVYGYPSFFMHFIELSYEHILCTYGLLTIVPFIMCFMTSFIEAGYQIDRLKLRSLYNPCTVVVCPLAIPFLRLAVPPKPVTVRCKYSSSWQYVTVKKWVADAPRIYLNQSESVAACTV